MTVEQVCDAIVKNDLVSPSIAVETVLEAVLTIALNESHNYEPETAVIRIINHLRDKSAYARIRFRAT